jgi:CubicO group peptidase (beta-lactamase class C family)
MSADMNLKSECEIILRRFGAPAVGMARIVGTGIESLACLGERKHGSGIAVTENDLWHIGSCTKSMTATYLARYVERGELEWDAPLAPLFDAYGFEVHPAFSELTLRHMLTHRAGMPVDPSPTAAEACVTYSEAWQQRLAFAEATLREGPAQGLGEEFSYSNLGYIVAGALAETMTGTAWEELMKRDFFSPLGLASASFGPPGRGSRGTLARLLGRDAVTQPWGHMLDSGAFNALDPDCDEADGPPVSGPSGTVHLSLADFARFVAYHVSRGASVPGYLSPETVESLHVPVPGEDYALGWFTPPAEATGFGKFAFFHEGTNEAWYAGMFVVPEDRRGLAWVFNACPETVLDPKKGMMVAVLEEIYNRWSVPMA